MLVLELLLLSDSPHLGENVFGINYAKFWYICCCVAVCLLGVNPKNQKTKKIKKLNCVCTLPGPVFYIIVSAWTCMTMEFNWWMVFSFLPGSICVSGFATPVVNCGTARVPMGLPM